MASAKSVHGAPLSVLRAVPDQHFIPPCLKILRDRIAAYYCCSTVR